MAEYEAERGMPADAETVFAVACDVGRMSRWLPAPVEVPGPTRLRMHGEVAGRPVDAEGRYAAVPGQLRLEWGRAEYAGWLQVSHADRGSAVTLHLSFVGDLPEADAGRAESERLTAELHTALDRLADQVGAVGRELGRDTPAPER